LVSISTEFLRSMGGDGRFEGTRGCDFTKA
jgi:hypothetical protein